MDSLFAAFSPSKWTQDGVLIASPKRTPAAPRPARRNESWAIRAMLSLTLAGCTATQFDLASSYASAPPAVERFSVEVSGDNDRIDPAEWPRLMALARSARVATEEPEPEEDDPFL